MELETYAFGAHYVLRTFVRPEFTRLALKEIQEQLAGRLAIRISAQDSREAQLQQIAFHLQLYNKLHTSSKLSEISSLVHFFRGLTEVALIAGALYVRQLPDVYHIQLLEGLNALTAGQIDRGVERYFAPSAARVVLAGDPALIESQLRGADFGAVERLPPRLSLHVHRPPAPAGARRVLGQLDIRRRFSYDKKFYCCSQAVPPIAIRFLRVHHARNH